MANFQKHHKDVNGQTLKAPDAKTCELGLSDPFFSRGGEELTVSVSPPNPAVTVTKGDMLQGQQLRLYKSSNIPAELTQLVALDGGGRRWECSSQDKADSQVAAAEGLAHVATDDEAKAHGWKCPNVVVVFSPPHVQGRFRAYSSLADGAQRWLGYHKTIAANHADFLTSLNDGDTAAVAHALKMVRYYTASEADYALAMKRMKDAVDKELGSLP